MNILVIRTHRMGDVLQLTPMLQGLKTKDPQSVVTFLTSTDMEDILSSNPNVDDIITIPETKYRYYLREKPKYYAQVYNEMYDLVVELKKKGFHRIINRQYEIGSVLAWLTGSSDIRGGAFSPERGFFFDDDPSQRLYDIIKKDRKANRRNLVDWACHIAGVTPGCGRMTFCLSESDRMKADDLLEKIGASQDGSPVAIQMGAARSFRQWGAENFLTIIRWLITVMDKTIVLVGSENEKDQAEAVCRSLGTAAKHVFNLTGKTTLKTLGSILERCRCLITGDTGTMHMATAVGTPVISLFYGTAYPWETGPYGTGHMVIYANEPCAPCLNPEDCIVGQKCRQTIQPEHVCSAFKMAEGLNENECDLHLWQTNHVRLLIAHAHSGYDQELIPIEEMNRGLEWSSFPRKAPGMELNRAKAVETGFDELLKKSEQIVRHFYRGNLQDFLEAVPEYVEQWSEMVAFFNKGQFGHIHSKELEHQLAPALNQACRAMAARDYTTVVDVIRYQFEPIIKSGIQGITG